MTLVTITVTMHNKKIIFKNVTNIFTVKRIDKIFPHKINCRFENKKCPRNKFE